MISRAGIVLTIAITTLFPHCLGYHLYLAALAGISSAPLAIKACSRIKRSVKPFQAAAAGLVAGNILLYLFISLPLVDGAKSIVLATLLILLLLSPCAVSDSGSIRLMVKYLPVVFVFQLVGGLMYGFLMKAYTAQSFLKGSELLFYILAVIGGVYVTSRRLDALLALGVMGAMFSFSFLLGNTAFATNISMYAMQGATGFVDLFLLCLLLSCEGTAKALGYGLATTCFAIVCGKVLSNVAGEELSLIVSAGNIILTLSVLLLYFKSKTSESFPNLCVETGAPVQQIDTSAAGTANDFQGRSNVVPRGFSKRFSEKEKKVLELVLTGKTFKEVASCLEISESSVKTYMKRIYQKTGVSGKTELVSLIDGVNDSLNKH
ncbi:MAG: helix-turn-helix transcriptional regulator [Geobacteraceae bacterium]|nr:helix-turn-helix transcriptional regulator [Geobacteraceae bacterium]